MSLGTLFLEAINASVPVIFLTLFGFAASFKLFPPKLYGLVSALTFSISMPISTIYTLGKQSVGLEEVKFIAAYLLTSVCTVILLFPQALLYEQYLGGLSHLIVIVTVNNAIFSGIPVCQGLYDANMCNKYGYLIMLGTNITILPVVYTLFEISAARVAASATYEKTSNMRIFVNALFRAMKEPMVISVIIGLVYCVVESFILPSLGRLPVYFSELFDLFGDFAATFAMIMLGFFLSNELAALRRMHGGAPMGRKELLSFILIIIHRHLTTPLLLMSFCKLLAVDYEIAEISAILYSGPTAIISFAISDQYGIGSFAAGIESCFGVFIGTLVIPLVELACRSLYKIK